jgi:hypothetical protein
MISRIKKLLKEIYVSTEPSRWQSGKTFDIIKNPSYDEFIKFAREINFLEFNPLKNLMLRFIIDTSNGDLYIWDGQHALHRDLFKILKLKTKSYIGGVFNDSSKVIYYDPNSYSSEFDHEPQLMINHTIFSLSKYIKNITDYKFNIEGEYFKVDDNGEILES